MSGKPTALAATLSAAMAVASCNTVLGIEHLPPGTAESAPSLDASAPFTYATPACAQCTTTSCAGAEAACAADDTCAADFRCFANCAVDDAACRLGCWRGANAPSAAAFAALDSCRRRACVDSCFGTGHLLDQFGPECAACAETACRGALTACIQSGLGDDAGTTPVGGCERRWACQATASPANPAAFVDCAAADPSPDGTGGDVLTCVTGSACAATTCRIGSDYRCTGEYGWPARTQPSVPCSLWFVGGGPRPFAGLQVDVCLQIPCGTPLSTGKTDAAGHVVVDLPATSVVGFTGALTLTSDDVMPSLLVFGRPFSHAETHIYGLFSRTEVALAASTLGVPLDDTRGIVVLGPWDCQYLSGVDVTVEPLGVGERIVYVRAGQVSLTATATDGTGGVALVNVPPGLVALTTRSSTTGERIATVQVPVVAGTITYAFAYPATR